MSATSALNPAALQLPDAARVLTAAGGRTVDVDMLQADIAAGVPINADGTLNLTFFTAWLIRETASGEAWPASIEAVPPRC